MKKNTYSANHLDKTVIYLFLATFLVSLSVFAFRYSSHTSCEATTFNIITNDYTIGALIRFEDITLGAEKWEWDFGDGTSKSNQKNPLHNFNSPGEYIVSLKVNNTCEFNRTIEINDKAEILDSTKFPIFSIPKSIKVGETLTIKDETQNATTWEWRFGETASSNSKSRIAKYVYKDPGLKTISLIVNGDLKYITKKKIEVIPIAVVQDKVAEIKKEESPGWKIKQKPNETIVGEKNAPKVVPYISDSDFANKLLLVSKEEMSPKQFTEYFCGDINKPIIVNGKSTTFLLLCEKISDKKIKIKKIEIFRDKGSNCIKTITLDYKKSGLF